MSTAEFGTDNYNGFLKDKFASGGFVVPTVEDRKFVLIDRGWWKCKKCGIIFESSTTPPLNHFCSFEVEYTDEP